MKKLILPILMAVWLSGCASASHNYQKKSKEEIEAIFLCGMGYHMENGVYIGAIEKNIYEDGIVTSEEEKILFLYRSCLNCLKKKPVENE